MLLSLFKTNNMVISRDIEIVYFSNNVMEIRLNIKTKE
jgi:hypothetical protein